MNEIQKYTFENGFRLIHETTLKCSNTASIQIFCDIGSIHEPDEFRGAAHFIEHMCFKGTTKTPYSKDIILNFEKHGSNVNAFTDRRYTCYYLDINKENVETSIKTMADMLLNSIFDKHEYEKEHAVVKEENKISKNDNQSLCLEEADRQLYDGSPYEHTVDDIKYHVGKNALARDTVFEMYKKFYIPSRIILSICCPNSFEFVKRAITKSDFVKKTTDVSIIPPLVLALTPQTRAIYNFNIKKSFTSTYICIGFRTCPVYNIDRYALKVLKNILSGKMSSRMFMILREENGLTYSSRAYTDYYEHSGDFKIYAECDTEKVFKNGDKLGVYPLLIKLIKDLIDNGVKEEEIRLSKGYMKGNMDMKTEYNSVKAFYNGENEIYQMKNTVSYNKKYETFIEPVTKKQIDDVIRKYFVRQGMVVSIVSNSSINTNKIVIISENEL
jgi:predicted Zn-dependent peptidase